ncbi:hypothetical protein QBC38DRAFT_517455 [Podospora fimiseda]|uniref:HECT-type E3 ubiquitin transferase n=1 Tax=Podospora fimiseda TaxID=252190 RepID=A0AAN7BUX0_9PEZI|nr:hypothetical protein QBC38DRAFT_517455 [Podospora fimiseda]
MFPTFTGNSRKTRKVDLSGQKPINPFAAVNRSFGPGASHTVAQAQAEREQRQRERERLKAAQRIQRCWRGHRVRRKLRASRRCSIDQLYSQGFKISPEERSKQATPLILSSFLASDQEDRQRLELLCRDLVATSFVAFTLDAVDPARLGRLSEIVLTALETGPFSANPRVEVFFHAISKIISLRPKATEPLFRRYYTVLGKYCQALGPSPPSPFLDIVRNSVVESFTLSNVSESYIDTAYQEFADSFLTQSDIHLFEQNVDGFAARIDLDRLAQSLVKIENLRGAAANGKLMWLLAHFIALRTSGHQHAAHLPSLKALYSLLSVLSTQIRASFSASAAEGIPEGVEVSQQTFPSYISASLTSLTVRTEISGLLEEFASGQKGVPGSETDDAGLLAGYILTLIYCFPRLGDDVRMRLFLADLPTSRGMVASVRFFWEAMSKTSMFQAIASSEDAALDILSTQKPSYATNPLSESELPWHKEWRTILLFLELYTFVLRFTDDDTFFSSINTSARTTDGNDSRLSASNLSFKELNQLTRFLKHLAFTLIYNAASILKIQTSTSGGFSGDFLAPRTSQKKAKALADSLTFVITAGIDLKGFRDLVTTAMGMLYERDSRRRFLPSDHWLMASKLNMEGFLNAVVEEAKQKQEDEEEEEEDEDEEEGGDRMDIDSRPMTTYASSRLHQRTQLERAREMQRQAARENVRATTSPKLEILRNMPFIIPFQMRVTIFRQFIMLDKQRRREGHTSPDMWRFWMRQNHMAGLSRHQATIKRGEVLSTAKQQFWNLGEGLKEPISITFQDEWGNEEAGIDGGGVTKEFLTSVTNEAITQDSVPNLFAANSENAYYPNPCALDQARELEMGRSSIQELLERYEFLGRIIGKCLYEGILINIHFAGFFLLTWALGADDTTRATINDLRELDEQMYQGMLKLKNYRGDVSDFGFDFTIDDQVSLPGAPVKVLTRKLRPGGDQIEVTNENRLVYINCVSRWRLRVQGYHQTRAFLKGLWMIIDPAWLRMFNQNELQRLVGGDDSPIDVEDLRKNTMYGGAYQIGDDGQEHPTVKLFWQVMMEMEDSERRSVLQFVTSTPRAPLSGFSQLTPNFSIKDNGLDEERLPSASTCVNLLKLPQYRTATVLREKLLYAAKSGAGFDLS